MHEVRPVTHGPRYSLLTWFTGPGSMDSPVRADGRAGIYGAARGTDET
jgi:hypothetical protein